MVYPLPRCGNGLMGIVQRLSCTGRLLLVGIWRDIFGVSFTTGRKGYSHLHGYDASCDRSYSDKQKISLYVGSLVNLTSLARLHRARVGD